MVSEITTRKDIKNLVDSFYTKVRKDELIGPFFHKMIPIEKWPSHISKLTDFWETTLLGVPKFKGNPVKAHQNMDNTTNHSIEQEHFGRWLHLWFSTIDELFTGDLADRAKNAARGIATGQFLAIWNARPNKINIQNDK
ncbi:MAG: group III truncated hemoglobin [Crocinitomicaceae bacterium]|nr:group III truncated hemoglobin [Crocinitomicaceae bacterium]